MHFHEAIQQQNKHAADISLAEFIATINAMDKSKIVPFVKSPRQIEATEEF